MWHGKTNPIKPGQKIEADNTLNKNIRSSQMKKKKSCTSM